MSSQSKKSRFSALLSFESEELAGIPSFHQRCLPGGIRVNTIISIVSGNFTNIINDA
jgi:hypothetical protein